MKPILSFICLLLSLCLSLPVMAESMPNDLSQWDSVTLDVSLPHKFKANLDLQARMNRNVTNLDQLIVRPSIGYQLTPNVSVWQGYGWMPRFTDGVQNEHRIWQQVLLEHSIKDVSVTNRFRLEERLIESVSKPSVRGRHMLRLSKPIGVSKKWYITGSNEFFINLNSRNNGPKGGFDQNRTFMGLGRKLNDKASVEAGYQLQYTNQNNTPDRLNHIALINLKLKL